MPTHKKVFYTSTVYLLIEADSWFPLNRNMLLGYLILYANSKQIVSKDFFPLKIKTEVTFMSNNYQ